MDFIFKSRDKTREHVPAGAGDNKAFGAATETSHRASEDLLSHVEAVSSHIANLVVSHNEAMTELGNLRVERARLSSLLDDETSVRRRLETLTARQETENTDLKASVVRLTADLEKTGTALAELQGIHATQSEQSAALRQRLQTSEAELEESAEQIDHARHALAQARDEIKSRGNDLASVSAALDNERAVRTLETEAARRENAALGRELARLADERTQLNKDRDRRQSEAEAHASHAVRLTQELSGLEARYRETREELETLRANSEMEISHLNARIDSVTSKSELMEKLLATARDRNATTDSELQTIRGELRAAKTELAGALARAERLTDDLARSRTTATESEAGRRTLAARLEETAARLREIESTCGALEREISALRREHETRISADRTEIEHLCGSLDVARSEIEQIRTENALLTGQIEAARAERRPVNAGLPRASDALSVVKTPGRKMSGEKQNGGHAPHAAQ